MREQKNLNAENYLGAGFDATAGAAATALDGIKRMPYREPKSIRELTPKELKELIDFMSSKYLKEVQETKDFLYNVVDKETTRRINAFPYFLGQNNQDRYFRLRADAPYSEFEKNVYFFQVEHLELIEENKTFWFGSVGSGHNNEPIDELYDIKAYAAVKGFVIKNNKTIERFYTTPDKNYQIIDNTLFGRNDNDEFFMTVIKWKSASLDPGKYLYDDSLFKAEPITKDEYEITLKNITL